MAPMRGRARSSAGRPRLSNRRAIKPARPAPVVPILRQPHVPARSVIMAHFAPTLWPRFARANVDILGLAHAAYTGLRAATRTIRGRGANIFTQWIGDPDALGSAVVLQKILEHLGAKEVRILTGALGHPPPSLITHRSYIVLQD